MCGGGRISYVEGAEEPRGNKKIEDKISRHDEKMHADQV